MTAQTAPPLPRRRPLALSFATLVIFLATVYYTIIAARQMSGGMSMPGGWTMSMMWMRMPGQSALGAAAMFVGMWTAMMIAMMLPSALPMILIYRRVVTFHHLRWARLRLWLLAGGYFAVWAGLGVVAFLIGTATANQAMKSASVSRVVPIVAAVCIIACGAYQWTPLKRACLKHCRDPVCDVAQHLHAGPIGALRLGLHHGMFCAICCWSLMAMQIVFGMMNLVVMAAIALVITAEKMLPGGFAVAKIVGTVAIAAGLWMLFVAARG